MLTPFDDQLCHQIADTFDHAGTSDPRFYDRHWFAVNDPQGSYALQLTMGFYRNMNVADAGLTVVSGPHQHNVRATRSLRTDWTTRCGPLSIEVVEPLRRFRLTIAENDGPVSGVVDWTATGEAEEEAPHFARIRGRASEDYRRFNQIGVAEGELVVDGRRVDVSTWWACRDRSWGVRPRMGVKEPVTGPVQQLTSEGYALAFLFFSTERLSGHVHMNWRGAEQKYDDAHVRDRSTGELLDVVKSSLSVELFEGTRRFREAHIILTLADGEEVPLHVKASGAAVAMKGLGYSGGYDDGAGLGVWRGDDRVEIDSWGVGDPSVISYPDGGRDEHWHRIQPVRLSSAVGGQTTMGGGSMTLVLSGRLPSFGLA